MKIYKYHKNILNIYSQSQLLCLKDTVILQCTNANYAKYVWETVMLEMKPRSSKGSTWMYFFYLPVIQMYELFST